MRNLAESMLQDIAVGLRGLRRDRGFAVVAVLTLALGIGASSAIYTLVDGVLLSPLPYPRPHELVAVSPDHSFMRAEYAIARERMQTVTSLAGYQPGVGMSVSVDDDALRLVGALVSANLLGTLEVSPAGRGFEAAHERVGADVAIISQRLWRQRFGGEPSALGRTLLIDGTPRRIIGIMPAGFAFPDEATDVWLPATIDPAELATYWGVGGMRAIGRLRAGATPTAVQRELRGLAEEMRLANPFWTPRAGYRSENSALPLREALVGEVNVMLIVLLGAVLLVWLIACANVGNLMLARGLAREGELAVRMAIGAGRGRIVRQMLTESTVLASIGGVAGLAVGWMLLRALLPHLPADLPRAAEIGLDLRVIAFTGMASLLAAALFGTLPALRVARVRDAAALREGQRSGTSGRRRRLSSSLVIAEVALAMVLVTGAGLLLRSLGNVSRIDPGFETAGVVTARLSPPAGTYVEHSRRLAYYEQVLERIQSAPGVQSAAITRQLPFDGELSLSAAAVEHVTTDPNELPVFELRSVTPDYFTTLRIPIIEGRTFDAGDRAAALPVAIVDRTAAEMFWPGESPIGRRIGRPWLREWRTVVGVAGSVRNNDVKTEASPALYLPLAQESGAAAVIAVRAAGSAADIAALIRSASREADPHVPVSHVAQYRDLISTAAARDRVAALLVAVFAALAMTLGAIGLYGVLSYAVTQRTHELSIRAALGAPRGSLLRLVLRHGLILGSAGILIGIPAALIAARALRSLLYGVDVMDPHNLLLVALILFATSAAAALLPALRALRAAPADAFRV